MNSPSRRQLLEVEGLEVVFGEPPREVRAVRRLSLTVGRGESVGLVGESGSGKSVTALSILQLLPYPTARHPGGSIRLAAAEEAAGEDAKEG